MNKQEIKEKYVEGMKEVLRCRFRWVSEARKAVKLSEKIDMLPEFPEEPKWTSFEEGKIEFQFRYDKFLIRKIKKLVIDSGFEIFFELEEKDCHNSYEHPFFKFSADGLIVEVKFSDRWEGSTCHRHQIGKELKEVPVYEWTCEEK